MGGGASWCTYAIVDESSDVDAPMAGHRSHRVRAKDTAFAYSSVELPQVSLEKSFCMFALIQGQWSY